VDDLRAVRPGQAHADRHPQQLGARPGRARPVRRRSRCRPGTSAPAQRTRSPGPPPDEVRRAVWRCGDAISTVPACCLHDRTAVRL